MRRYAPWRGPGHGAARLASWGLVAVLVLSTAAAGAGVVLTSRAAAVAERSVHVSGLYDTVERALLLENAAEREFLETRRAAERSAHAALAAAVVELLGQLRSVQEPERRGHVDELLAQHDRYRSLTARVFDQVQGAGPQRGRVLHDSLAPVSRALQTQVGEQAAEHRDRARSTLAALGQARRAVLAGMPVVLGVVLALSTLFTQVLRGHRRVLDAQASRAQHEALHDALTGLANRALFARRLRVALEQGSSPGEPAALLLLDLNGFKDVNDRLGHQAGDALLAQVAQRIEGVVRACDTAARLGGDEFAVVVARLPGDAALDSITTRLAAAFTEPFVVADSALPVGVSVGVAVQGRDGQDPEELLRRADAAMYAAKRAGGGVEHYHPARDDAGARRTLLADLRSANSGGQLRLHYQPSVRLSDGLVTGAEALVRWQHPVRGLVPPDEFIPLAEHSDLLLPLTEWVLDEAAAQCRWWLDAGLDLCVAVNLSAGSTVDDALPGLVSRVLSRHALPAERMALEITETSLIHRPQDARRILGQLVDLGVNIAVDDFGTGYATLAWLQQLPFNALKIDRGFVADMVTGGVGAELVRYTTQLAQALGKVVVAEGVETAEQEAALRRMGCHHAQGYYIGRPVPAGDFHAWLERAQISGRYSVGALAPRAQPLPGGVPVPAAPSGALPGSGARGGLQPASAP